MAVNITRQTLSVDYFSLGRRKSDTSNVPSSITWDQSPTSDPTLQSPSSDESLTVSPVSPYTLPFSRGGYALPAPQDIQPKSDPSSLYNSSFEDWMGWEDSADNTLYPSVKPDYMNLKLEPTSPIMEAMELSGGLGISDMSAMMGNGLDDGSVAFQDTLNEEPLFQAPQDMQVQQNNDMFSNPMPWSQSQSRHHRNQQSNTAYPTLSQSETSNLISTAMPTTSVVASSPPSQRPENRRKRKSTSSAASSSSSASSNPPPRRQSAPVKKTAHNMIEKRYRTNLNDKIAALRDSVPCLRSDKKDFNGDSTMQEDLGGLEAAQKLNKATILSKATEYIAHLEKRNAYLSKECQSLKDRVDAFEILLMSQSGPAGTNHAQQNHNKTRWKQQHAHAAASTTS